MYTVLTGAKINVGDYLITDRTEKLLQHLRPEHELLKLPHWESLDAHLDEVNRSDAVIIMGGPGFQPGFYPRVYKLCANLDNIIPPVIPLGLGWKGYPGDYNSQTQYRFTSQSLDALNRFSKRVPYFSCRDYPTKAVLNNHGISNVLMTGCPVWYDIPSIGKPVVPPKKIERVVFSPAQRYLFKEQSIHILHLLKTMFPSATLYCSFNRGIRSDNPFTPKSDETNNLAINAVAESLGYTIVDAAFDLSKIDFYDDCDLHVGYRVHSHLYFLSKRKPSVLLHEDGRGNGVSESLNIIGINAYKRQFPFGRVVPNEHTVDILKQRITEEVDNQFARYAGLSNVIDAHFEIMKTFVASLP